MTTEEMENLRKQLAENTRITTEIFKMLVGSQEFRTPGLVDELNTIKTDLKDLRAISDRHERIIIKWGGAVAAILFVLDVGKLFADLNHK